MKNLAEKKKKNSLASKEEVKLKKKTNIMRKITMLCIAFAFINCIAKASENKEVKITEKKMYSCTATVSEIRSGSVEACNGLEVTLSATASCTDTQPTCMEAIATARICAGLKAQQEVNSGLVAVSTDCPAGEGN